LFHLKRRVKKSDQQRSQDTREYVCVEGMNEKKEEIEEELFLIIFSVGVINPYCNPFLHDKES